MSSLEPVPSWQDRRTTMKVTRTILAPDIPPETPSPPPPPISSQLPDRPLSPAYSSSDGDNSRSSVFSVRACSPLEIISSPRSLEALSSPRSLSAFHSLRLLACGGPGFSLGVIDCETGSTDQLSVPFPREQVELTPEEVTAFTFHDITSMDIVGERQLWVGTSSGTLHIFELASSFRLKQHALIKINEPILCIASRPMEYVFPSEAPLTSRGPQMEVLLGIPHGYIVILEGHADEHGRLRDVLKLSRKVVRFTDSSVDCAVNCITHVSGKSETFWCSCGANIVVLHRCSWHKLHQINAKLGLPTSSPSYPEVTQLLPSEGGVWSSLSHSPTITLWDKETYSAKLHVTVSEFHDSLLVRPDVTALHCFQSLLFVGTARGDLIVFRVDNALCNSPPHKVRPTNGLGQHPSRATFHHIASYHCGHSPVKSIYTTSHQQVPNIFGREPCEEASLIHIMAIVGSSTSEEPSECLLKAFDLVVSSPFSPSSTPSLNSSVISNDGSQRRRPTPGVSLSLVSTNSHNFLPLQS